MMILDMRGNKLSAKDKTSTFELSSHHYHRQPGGNPIKEMCRP